MKYLQRFLTEKSENSRPELPTEPTEVHKPSNEEDFVGFVGSSLEESPSFQEKPSDAAVHALPEATKEVEHPSSSVTGATCARDSWNLELWARLEGYRPLVEAAQNGLLPPGPVVLAPGLTVIDPKQFVLSTWRELQSWAERAQTNPPQPLHPTTKARLERQCERLNDMAAWFDLELWGQP